MIGRARPGEVRPWQLAAAITALRAAFPQAKVLPQRRGWGREVRDAETRDRGARPA